jgi:hypothetical protein
VQETTALAAQQVHESQAVDEHVGREPPVGRGNGMPERCQALAFPSEPFGCQLMQHRRFRRLLEPQLGSKELSEQCVKAEPVVLPRDPLHETAARRQLLEHLNVAVLSGQLLDQRWIELLDDARAQQEPPPFGWLSLEHLVHQVLRHVSRVPAKGLDRRAHVRLRLQAHRGEPQCGRPTAGSGPQRADLLRGEHQSFTFHPGGNLAGSERQVLGAQLAQ